MHCLKCHSRNVIETHGGCWRCLELSGSLTALRVSAVRRSEYPPPLLACGCCHQPDGVQGCIVQPTSARTCYSWDGIGDNPNGDLLLCQYCTEDHHAEWDERWADYYGGLL